MRIPKRITVKFLKDNEACPEGIRRFRRLYPNGVNVTKANILRWLALTETIDLGSSGVDQVAWLTDRVFGYKWVDDNQLCHLLYSQYYSNKHNKYADIILKKFQKAWAKQEK